MNDQPTQDTLQRQRREELRRRVLAALLIGLVVLPIALTLIHLAGGIDLLLPAGGKDKEGLHDLWEKIDAVKKPATAATGGLAGLGLVAGVSMLSLGMQSGTRVATMSGAAGGGLALGNGLIS